MSRFSLSTAVRARNRECYPAAAVWHDTSIGAPPLARERREMRRVAGAGPGRGVIAADTILSRGLTRDRKAKEAENGKRNTGFSLYLQKILYGADTSYYEAEDKSGV
ncbi:hypothetical protein KM043_009873 [Ampulex compressa]|nr:hypothetical protein KM043_009873 [Ampulex compressa]